MVVEADPAADHARGVGEAFEAMAMYALLLEGAYDPFAKPDVTRRVDQDQSAETRRLTTGPKRESDERSILSKSSLRISWAGDADLHEEVGALWIAVRHGSFR